jgi:hypothetical protein
MNRCAEIVSPQQPQRGCQINNKSLQLFFKLYLFAFTNLPGKVMGDGGYKIKCKGLFTYKKVRFAGFSIFINYIFSHELQTHDNHSNFFFLFVF